MTRLKTLIDEAEKIVQSIQIPSPPRILIDIEREVASNEPDFPKIKSLVEEDVALTARILKVANSPYFGTATRIETLQTALSVLGLKNFQELILASALKEAFSKSHMPLKELECFHSHSLLVARSAQIVAQKSIQKGHQALDLSLAYLAGLFHDCGMPMLSSRFDNYYENVRKFTQDDLFLMDLEESMYKTNHCIVGGFVARVWHLPENVCQAISLHHDWSKNKGPAEIEILVNLLQVTEVILADLFETDNIYLQRQVSGKEFQSKVQSLKLSMADIGDVVNQISHWQ